MISVLLCTLLLGAPTAQKDPFIMVLGTAQDAGFPQAGCRKQCCAAVWRDPGKRIMVSSLALVEPEDMSRWIFDATPDFRDQLRFLDRKLPVKGSPGLAGIFLTHAHIGHYTGLMQLGREVMGAKAVPVYAMPKMRGFLKSNGPWSQLVKLNNIALKSLEADKPVALGKRIKVTPFRVPHRDEFSETVGYLIAGPNKKAVFIPDIDKWSKWDRSIVELVRSVDYALLDATFYKDGEIPGRNMNEIPHPFMEETMALLAKEPEAVRNRVIFIHMNHTNPALDPGGAAHHEVNRKGFRIAFQGQVLSL